MGEGDEMKLKLIEEGEEGEGVDPEKEKAKEKAWDRVFLDSAGGHHPYNPNLAS